MGWKMKRKTEIALKIAISGNGNFMNKVNDRIKIVRPTDLAWRGPCYRNHIFFLAHGHSNSTQIYRFSTPSPSPCSSLFGLVLPLPLQTSIFVEISQIVEKKYKK